MNNKYKDQIEKVAFGFGFGFGFSKRNPNAVRMDEAEKPSCAIESDRIANINNSMPAKKEVDITPANIVECCLDDYGIFPFSKNRRGKLEQMFDKETEKVNKEKPTTPAPNPKVEKKEDNESEK